MSGPPYSARGRSKCRLRNESLVEEGRNSFKRPPYRLQHACTRPLRFAPRPPTLGGHCGLGVSAQSARASGPDEPVILGDCPPRVGAAAAAADVQGGSKLRGSKLTEHPHSNFVKPVPRDAAAAAAQLLADLRALRDDQREGGRGGGQGGPTGGQRAGTGLGAVDMALPLLYMLHGCPPVVARILYCFGGGRWGQRQHKSIGMPLFDQDQLEHSNPAAAY